MSPGSERPREAADDERAVVKRCVAAFEEAWRRGERPCLDDLLPEGEPRRTVLIELVHTELEYRIKAGEPARVEEYLQRYPELADDRTAVLDLIAAECEFRRRREPVPREDYLQRFGQYREELAVRLPPQTLPSTIDEQTDSRQETLAEMPPRQPDISGYQILGELGRGGMGVVYKARQVRLDRVVALKMILSGSHAGAEERARFLREAEAVARLQHPNIVQIFEVGEHEDRPFFSMEFVDGDSLEQRIGGQPQPPREAAALVETLARAVHHAHQQGIVHRDLKPANILLTGGAAEALSACVPKITDFGLAKRLDQEAQLTPSNAVVGTPSYAAPEQVPSKGQSEVGPAADVYALGAILYHLLTGRPPFLGVTPLDILLQVRSTDPVSPTRLQPSIPRDLETICLKCLQKEPQRRFSSAEGLAEDLRRFLAGEPILARPIGAWQRGIKWAKRRPAIAALSAAIVFVTLLGFGLVTWKWQGELEARRRAEKNFQLATDMNSSVGDLAEQLKPLVETPSATVGKILQRAADNYKQLVAEAGETPPLLEGKARMLNSFSEVYIELGSTTRALETAKEAGELFQRLLQQEPAHAGWQAGLAVSQENLGIALQRQGKIRESLAAFRASFLLRKRLAQQETASAERQLDLSTSYYWIGTVLEMQGDYPRAEVEARQALAIRERFALKDRTEREGQRKLVLSHEQIGRLRSFQEDEGGALQEFQKALRICEEVAEQYPDYTEVWKDLARIQERIGGKQGDLGDVPGAVQSYKKALDIAEQHGNLDPSSTEWQRHRFICRIKIADLRKQENLVEALQEQLFVLTELHPLAAARVKKKDPLNALWQRDLGFAKRFLGMARLGLAREGIDPAANLARAEEYLQAALHLNEDLVKKDSSNYESALVLGSSHLTIAELRRVQGDQHASLAAQRQSWQVMLDFYQPQAAKDPNNPAWQRGLAKQYDLIGALEFDHDLAAALAARREALKCYERLAQLEPNNESKWLLAQAESYRNIAGVLLAQAHNLGKGFQKSPLFAESLDADRQSVALREQLVKREPKNAQWRRELAEGYRSLFLSVRIQGNKDEIQATFQKYLDALAQFFALEEKADLFDIAEQAGISLKGTGVHPSVQISVDVELRRPGVLVSARKRLTGDVARYRLQRTPDVALDLVDGCIQLVGWLDTRTPAGAHEARWALRLGLGVLRQLQRENRLQQMTKRLIPQFERQLKKLPEEPLQKALDDVDFRRLAETLLEQNRHRDLVLLLARQARDSARIAWLQPWLQERVIEALVLEPRLYNAVLQCAREMLQEEFASRARVQKSVCEELTSRARVQVGGVLASSSGPIHALPFLYRKPEALEPSLGIEGRNLIATLAWTAGDVETAKAFDPDVLNTPLDTRLVSPLCDKLWDARHYQAGARMLGHVVGLMPAEKVPPDLYRVLAVRQLQARQTDQAAETLNRAIQKAAPDDAVNRLLLGQLYILARRFSNAQDHLIKLLDDAGLRDRHPLIRLMLSSVYLELGETGKAEALVRKVLDSDKENAGALATLAEIHAEQDTKLEQAEEMIRKALRSEHKDPEHEAILGWILARQKQTGQGLEILTKVSADEALARDPIFFDRLGDVYRQINSLDKARECWEKALQLFPRTTDPADRRKRAIEAKLQALERATDKR